MGDPETDGIKTPKGVIQNYDTIKQQCLSAGQLFEDPIFSPRASKRSDVVWLRPFEISQSPKFVSSGISRFDVVQGELGDCWLVAAVANLTLNKRLFDIVVPSDQSFDRGSYCGLFRFRFWQFGKWVEVVIDDKLPTKNGQLLFVHSSDADEFWSSMFEKAYAKLHGSYDALRGGTTCEAMVDLTGGLTEFFDVQTEETPQNLWNIIKQGFERGSLIGCSIEAQDESQRENELPNGLVKGHAYSITYVLEMEAGGRSLTMLRLRNPWSGTSEWNGPWCDKSREWNMISDYEKRKIGLTFEADGEFWMSFSDWKRNFTRVEMCNLSPDALDDHVQRQWYAQIFEGSWIRGRSAGGCRNNLQTFALNPQYLISLTDPDEEDDNDKCTMIVALMQKNRRSAKQYQMGSSDLTIGFAIYALNDGVLQSIPVGSSAPQFGQQLLGTEFFKYNCSVARSPTYINLREVTARFSLPPGTYAIIPSTFDRDEEGDFILRVWTESPAKSPRPNVQPVPPPEPLPAPRPSPRPSPVPPRPAEPAYPSYPSPKLPPEPDSDADKRKQPAPIYPPYPMPGQPTVPGYPPYPSQPSMPGAPTYPSYPAYPPLPAGGGDGGHFRYPALPDEPSIIRRKVPPPPPGPSIDISIGEVIGTVSTIVSILAMCYSAYQACSSASQTHPYGGGSSSRGPFQHQQQSYFTQSPGYSLSAPNPNSQQPKRDEQQSNNTSRL